jgi:hypothetical protein
MASQNSDEVRAAELRSKRDAYGSKTATDNAQALDFAHFMLCCNDEIVSKRGTK